MSTPSAIPEEFYKDDTQPVVRTVGELIKQLQRLPKSLPIETGFGDAAKLTVFNHGEPDMHLSIDEEDT